MITRFSLGLFSGLSAVCCFFALAGCSTPANSHSDAYEGEGDKSAHLRPTALARETAAVRAKHISHVTYTLWFGLDSAHDDYEGRVVIKFEFKRHANEKTKQIAIDFENGTIRTMGLNGTAIDNPSSDKKRYDGHRIYFGINELALGSNRVEIAFTHPYSHSGAGLHRFKDPVDGQVYLFSNFEPYDAHRMFPCFDQPDLKASYELTVETPQEWQVVANMMERDVSKVDGRKSWAFPPTPLLSTYLFALHAGPYASWKSNANGIPMRLFARQSVKQYVDSDEWFDITRKGLAFFAEDFGYPYPYSKYDQLLVPDFNAGAMENAAAITFNEPRYVFRSKVTRDEHRRRAWTILHEMAHMWFGDLVTMRWWNGLWLNESFATYMSTRALDESTRYPNVWEAFFGEKGWAYWEDQLVTTHPIEVPVPDTDFARSNFDGITYGKGAASLKQLHYFVGADDFREGIQRYFSRYAQRNTTTSEFIKMIAEASSQDLSKWQKSWLQTPGVNGLKADWACDPQGKISRFELVQSPSEFSPELRTHRTQIGLYSLSGRVIRLHSGKGAKDRISVTYSGARTSVDSAIGLPCPEFVFPNQDDYDYAKVELDPVSLQNLPKAISRFEDNLTRAMLWHTFWQMVVDGKVRAQDYADVVLSQLGKEQDSLMLGRVLKTLVRSDSDPSALFYLKGDLRSEYAAKIEKFTQAHLLSAAPGSDLQLVWFDAYLHSANSADARTFEESLLNGKRKVSGLRIEQDRRWELVQALARQGAPSATDLIAQESKRDATDMGEKSAIEAEAQIPDTAVKKKWLGQILEAKLPVSRLREAMNGFNVLGQETFTRSMSDSYFDQIVKLASDSRAEDQEYYNSFARRMYPALCDTSVIQKTTEVLKAHPELPASVMKALKIGRQETERCVRAQEKSASAATMIVPAPAPAPAPAPVPPASVPNVAPSSAPGARP